MHLKTRRIEPPQVSSQAEESSQKHPKGSWLPSRNLLLLLAATTLLHLVLAFHYPLSEDESYYWDWSRNLDWGYYDQGPMIAWWIRAACSLFGDTIIGIRIGAIVASLGIQVIAYLTLRKLVDERSSTWGVAALSLTPLATVGGFVFTYDSIMILFWSVAVYAAVRLTRESSSWLWLLFGAALGLGLLSKLTMALALPCAALALLLASERKGWWKSLWPYLSVVLAGLIYLPNFLWQAGHDWATFEHIRNLSRASQGKGFLSRAGDFVGSQLAVITPILAVVVVAALVFVWKNRRDRTSVPLWAFGAPVLLLFLLSTANGKVLGNWAAAGWYSSCLLAGAWAARSESRKWKIAFKAGIASAAVLSLVAVFPEAIRALGIRMPESVNRPSNRMFGGEELARAVAPYQKEGLLPAGSEYQQVSRLGFYLPGQPRVLSLYPATRPNDYIFRSPDRALETGDDILLVLEMPLRKNERAALLQGFKTVDDTPVKVPIFRPSVHEEPVRTYYLYKVFGFRPDSAGALLDPRQPKR